jgi:hypothetical protein
MMTFKNLLVAKAVVCLVFGAQLLLVPAFLLGLLGAPVNDGSILMGREYGAAMVGILVLTWTAREIAHSETRRSILLFMLVYDAIGFVVVSMAVAVGTFNLLGLGISAVYLFFSVGPAYLLRKGETEPAKRPAVS